MTSIPEQSPALIVLAALVVGAACDVALRMLRDVTEDSERRGAFVGRAALILALGVWTAHVLSVIALRGVQPSRYDLVVTLLSFFPTALGAIGCLGILLLRSRPWWHAPAAAASLTVVIVGVHLFGMSAVHGETERVLGGAGLTAWLVAVAGSGLLCAVTWLAWADSGSRDIRLRLVCTALFASLALGGHQVGLGASTARPQAHLEAAVHWGTAEQLLALTLGLVAAGIAVIASLAPRDRRPGPNGARSTDQALASGERLALATEAGGIGIWDWDVREGALVWNRAMYDLYGLDPEQVAGRLDAWRRAVHSDDAGALWEQVERALEDGARFDAEFRIVRPDGATRWVRAEARVQRDEHGASRVIGVSWDTTDWRLKTLRLERLLAAFEQAGEGIAILDLEGRIEHANAGFAAMTGYSLEEARGLVPDCLLLDGESGVDRHPAWAEIQRGKIWSGSGVSERKDGTTYQTESSIAPVRDEDGSISAYVLVRRDVTEQRGLERQLRRAQKLESIGQLAAGIAHDLNSPAQFVGHNIRFLSSAFSTLRDLHAAAEPWRKRLAARPEWADLLSEVDAAVEESDLEFLLDEVPQAIEQSMEGIQRISQIVKAMKDFSHPSSEIGPADLNAAIRSTSIVAEHEWKYVADLTLDLEANLPLVECDIGEFNQVVLNMIINAAHAIEEVGGDDKGEITIRSRRADDSVVVEISDTGGGIPEELLERVFDPFFTTKSVGKGTGQGLSLAHTVIVGKHAGSIDVESTRGEGTTFVLTLPTEQPESIAESGEPASEGESGGETASEDESGETASEAPSMERVG